MYFLGNKYSESEQLAIGRSTLWPVYVALYNASGGNALIWNGDGHQSLHFSTKQGFPFAFVESRQNRKGDFQYAFDFYHDPLSRSKPTGKPEYRSTSAKYIANKVKKLAGAAEHFIKKGPDRLVKSFFEMNRDLAKNTYQKLLDRPSIVIDNNLSPELVLQVVRFITCDIDRTQLSGELVKFCEENLARLNREREIQARQAEEYRTFYARQKLLIVPDMCNGLVIAHINQDFINEVVKCSAEERFSSIALGDAYNKRKKAGLSAFDSCTWYPSFAYVPKELITSINASLMMLKVHSNSTGSLPDLSQVNYARWPDIGAAAISLYGERDVYMIEI